jgi:Uma2 family endonuclease
MATQTKRPDSPDDIVAAGPWRFTAKDYHRMGKAGIFGPEDRVELIDGEVIRMSPIGDPHAGRVIFLTRLFTLRLGQEAFVSAQNPVRLSQYSEPEPDLVIMRSPLDPSAVRAPRPEDVLLLIEVCDTTLAYDRDKKVPLYAEAGIPETWLLDLPAGRLRVYREPDGREYRRIEVLARGSRIAPLAFPEMAFSVDEILG